MFKQTAILLGVTGQSLAAELNFLVMGDWGGIPDFPFTTEEEVATAAGMNLVASQVNARYSLAIGDNFYESGIANLTDSRFNTSFEEVFTGDNLKSTNFFRVLAGNHDHYGNVSAQILYTDVNDRWSFPDYYYDFVESYGGEDDTQFKLHTIMLDTVLLAGESALADGTPLKGSEYVNVDKKVQEKQLAWLEATLAASEGDVIIVAGHYPVWSICEHGPTDFMVAEVAPLLEKYNVQAFLAGHDHCAELIADGGVQYHGIGSAHKNDASTAHKDSIPADSLKFHSGEDEAGGFARIRLSGETGAVLVEHYDGFGSLKFTGDEMGIRGIGATTEASV